VQTVPIGFHPVPIWGRSAGAAYQWPVITFLRSPPFAPAYAHYTKTLSRFVYGLSRVMTLSDVAEWTLLSWDTVKAIAKTHLARDYGKPVLTGRALSGHR